MEKTKESTVKITEKKVTTKAEPRNFLATLLFAISFGQMGVNRLYSGDMTLGWIRFGLFAGGMLLSPFVIGLPLMFAAQVWGWVDVFLVYHGKRVDADGVAMTQNERDRKAAKIIYILFIIGLAMALLMFVVLIIFLVVMGATWSNPDNDFHYGPRPYLEQTY